MTVPTFQPTSLSEHLLKLFPQGHISPSQAKQAMKCLEQFRRVKVLGYKARPSAATEWGSADHDAAGHSYEKKILTEKDLPVAEVQEFFVNDFERRVDELGGPGEIEWDGDKDFAGKTPVQGVAVVKDKGVKLVAAYQECIAGDLFPETVEEPLEFEPDGLGITIKGRIDVVARRRDGFTKEFSEPMILERKTRAQIRAPKPEDRFQARVYQLARPFPAEFHISARPSARVQTYEPEPLEAPEMTVRSLRAILLQISACYAIYGPDQPWPDNGRLHDWACSYCSFKSTCPWWHEEYWPK